MQDFECPAIHNFLSMYPSMKPRILKYKQLTENHFIISLDDGLDILYDDFSKYYRVVKINIKNMTDEEYRKEFGLRLQSIMEQRGVSQNWLAYRAGVTQPTIGTYINGKNAPIIYTANSIARALRLSDDEIKFLYILE